MTQPELECHLLIPNTDRSSVVVRATDVGVLLPMVVPMLYDGDTLVTALLRHLNASWGLDLVVLETYLPPPHEEQPTIRPALAVFDAPIEEWSIPAGLGWWPIEDLRPVTHELVAPRIDSWLQEWKSDSEIPDRRPRWSRPGWHAAATAWISDALEVAGRRQDAAIEVRRLWGISAVMRASTTDGSAWFKAVFTLFHHEPQVTTELERIVATAVPHVIASDAPRGWLLLDDAGTRPTENEADFEILLAAIHSLVGVQADTLDRLSRFLEIGCPHRPLSALADALADVMADSVELEGPSVAPGRVAEVLDWVRDHATWLEAAGLPEALVHGDFHPGNIARRRHGPVILDWSDAAVSHPLMDIGAWFGEVEDRILRDRFWRGWLDALTRLGWVEGLRDEMEPVFGLAAAYQAVSYAWILRGLEPAHRYQVSDGFREFWAELDARVPRAE